MKMQTRDLKEERFCGVDPCDRRVRSIELFPNGFEEHTERTQFADQNEKRSTSRYTAIIVKYEE